MNGAAQPAPGETARISLRVRYAETDRMGVAYHAHYFVWFEMARTELMRQAGCPYRDLEDGEGVFFPVIGAAARFHASARYDDWLEVGARLVAVRGARLRIEYEVAERDGGRVLATGFTEHASVGRNGRPRRMPEDVVRRLLTRESKK